MAETYEGWTALHLTVAGVAEDDPRLDVLSSMLFELGAGGIETQEPGPGVTRLIASFPAEARPDVDGARELCAMVELEDVQVELSTYEAIDWSTHWRQHFHPVHFGAGEKRVDVV